MKVLVVTHNSDLSGGANRSLYMVLKSLRDNHNVEFKVLVPSKSGALADKLNNDGFNLIYKSYYGVITGIEHDGKDILRKIKARIGYIREKHLGKTLAKSLASENFDFVYTNTRLPYVGCEIAKQLKIPHICHIREFGPEEPYWPNWDYKQIYKNSNRLILISKALYNEYGKYVPKDRLVMIHNGIDSPTDLKKTDFGNHEGFHLLLTGRLVADKGHTDAINALKILSDKGYEDIYLHFAGSVHNPTLNSAYVQKIKSLIETSELEGQVDFLGEVSDMISLRSRYDCELMCAIKETFGRVTVEGMRSGLLVIGSNTGGTVEIIEDNVTGLLYEQGNSKDLAEKIEYAYLNREAAKTIARNGYEFAQNNFTTDKNTEEIYDVFKSVVNNKGES